MSETTVRFWPEAAAIEIAIQFISERPEAKAFVRLRREWLSLEWSRESHQREGHPPRRLPGSGNRSCVVSTPASMPLPCAGEKESTSCRLPCEPVVHDSPPHKGSGDHNQRQQPGQRHWSATCRV